jgi:GTP-binding protein HflX
LVESFSSTLDETRDAALLLHVVEAGLSDRDELIHHVNEVLAQIGAEDVPQLFVYNKVDKYDGLDARLERNEEGQINRIWLSAKTGEGIELLHQALHEYFPETIAEPETDIGFV